MRSVDIVDPAVARKFTAGPVPAYCAVPFDTRIEMISEHEVDRPGFGPTYPTPIPARDDGALVAGVTRKQGMIRTSSIVLRSHSGTIRRVEADHLVSKWYGEKA